MQSKPRNKYTLPVDMLQKLLELSLHTVNNADLQKNCYSFLKKLNQVLAFSHTSIWLERQDIGSNPENFRSTFYPFSEFPEKSIDNITLDTHHHCITQLKQQPYLLLDDTSPMFSQYIHEYDVAGGSYGIYNLDNWGFIKLYRDQSLPNISLDEIRMLAPVLDSFGRVIQVNNHSLSTLTLHNGICSPTLSHQIPSVLDINITDQVYQVEKTVQESEAKIRAIINSALDAVVVINQKGVVTEWNAQAEHIFGWTEREMKGLTLAETIIPPQYRDAHQMGFDHFLKTGEGPALNQRLEISAVNREGTEFPIELTIIPVKLKHKYFFSAFIRDITERKNAEEKKENLLKQLAQANSELKDFAYVVTHDLKAPLRAISSLTHWIADDYKEQFDEEGREQLELLRGRVNRMSDLISGILDYSRIGRMNTEIEKVSTHDLVSEIIDMIISEENVHIKLSKELPIIKYNRISLQQVFQNLISNAIKYNDKPLGKIDIGCMRESEHHTFWVRDNGPGIAPRYHEKIFKIFQTLRPRDEVEATGVGLSIVKKIVNLFGGKVWVESELEKGSCFFFTVPNEPKLNLDI